MAFRSVTLIALAPLALCLSLPVQASGARQGVTPRHGEMVLLRDVSTRPAYRSQPPGMALIADPSPQRELGQALGTPTGMEELDDGDYASLGAGMAGQAGHGHAAPASRVEQLTSAGVQGSLGRVTGRDGVLGSPVLGGGGAVGRATGGIAGQVQGALSQFGLTPAAPAGGRP